MQEKDKRINPQPLDKLVEDKLITKEACDQVKAWIRDCDELYSRVDKVILSGDTTTQNVTEIMLGIPRDSLPLFKDSLRPYKSY